MSKHRRRILVALIPPGDLIGRIEAVASLFGKRPDKRIPPHVTVVPPLNLSGSDVEAGLRILRGCTSQVEPFDLEFVGLSSFAPSAPTVHLVVGDPESGLGALRDMVRVGPLSREDPRPYKPHVTLVSSASESQIAAGHALNDARGSAGELVGGWRVDRLFVLEQTRHDTGTRWHVLSEEPFVRDLVVGRGGVELHLRTVGSIEPAAGALLAQFCVAMGTVGSAHTEGPSDPEPLCVTAEQTGAPGVPIGLAVGRVEGRSAWLDALVTAKEHRREGVARHVLAQWCYEAALRGASVALSRCDEALIDLGFTKAGDLSIRRLQ